MYLSAQKKKMRPFEGFNRKAIVCIPTQEDLKKRTEDRKKEGIELPENAVSDMKSMLMIMFILFPVFYSVDDPLDGMPIPHSLFLEGRGGGGWAKFLRTHIYFRVRARTQTQNDNSVIRSPFLHPS